MRKSERSLTPLEHVGKCQQIGRVLTGRLFVRNLDFRQSGVSQNSSNAKCPILGWGADVHQQD